MKTQKITFHQIKPKNKGKIVVKYPKSIEQGHRQIISGEIQAFLDDYPPKKNMVVKITESENGDLIASLRKKGPINYLKSLLSNNQLFEVLEKKKLTSMGYML